MDLQLENRVVLVVGGHGLIGTAVVDRLRDERAIAIPASRHATDGLVLDAADDESVAGALRRVLDRHHRLDGVVIAAAPSGRNLDPESNSNPAQVLAAVDAKALVFLRVAKAALPIMTAAGFGRIVGVSGQNAFTTGNVSGSVRNAALIIAAKSLADSVAGSGVTVNTVSPGIVTNSPGPTVEIGQGGESKPSDSANLITFLLSPLAAALSGESIAIGHRVRGVTVL